MGISRALSALLGILCISVGAWLVGPAVQAQTPAQSYLQTFDGMPAAPMAYRPPGWDVQIQSRDMQTWTSLEPMTAQHGPDCSPPPATFPLGGDYPSHVFQCHDHVMTAIQAGGYGVIYLTPPALADFSQGEVVIRWDMSTLRTSYRDWTDVWVSPLGDHLALPLENDFQVDLAGAPRRAVHAKMGQFFSAAGPWTSFGIETTRDFISTSLPNTLQGYETVLTPDAARRDTFEMHLSRTHVKIGMPAYNLWWTDTDIPDLGWTQGVVQFGHHSYNPAKDCTPSATLACTADTWHWDNVSISPAVPITITALSPRQISDQAPGGWVLPSPAPAESYLQFSANNAPNNTPQITLSFDGGQTWQTVQPQPSGLPTNDTIAARSYWVPLPAGTTAVQVRGQGGYWGGSWQAKDASVWTGSLTSCTPRPPVGVSVAAAGAGRLSVTVSAQNAPQTSPNSVQMLQFLGNGVRIQLDGQTYSTPFMVNLAARTSQKTFVIQQPSPGQAVTVPLVVVDACGPWSTFVGGGTSAIASGAPGTSSAPSAVAPNVAGTPPSAPSATPTRGPATATPTPLTHASVASMSAQVATPTPVPSVSTSTALAAAPLAVPSSPNVSVPTSVTRGPSVPNPSVGIASPSVVAPAGGAGAPARPSGPWMPLLGSPPGLPAPYPQQWMPFGYPGPPPGWPPAYPGNAWTVPPADLPPGAPLAPDEPNAP